MEYISTVLAVKNMEASKRFYVELLNQPVTMDLGANITVGNRVSLQTLDTWVDFIDKSTQDIRFNGQEVELYFEEENLDAFIEKLKGWPDVKWAHPLKQYPWGQRGLRFYDPDGHIVEVGESMKTVIKRFLLQGLSGEEVIEITEYPVEFIEMCKNEVREEGKR